MDFCGRYFRLVPCVSFIFVDSFGFWVDFCEVNLYVFYYVLQVSLHCLRFDGCCEAFFIVQWCLLLLLKFCSSACCASCFGNVLSAMA